MRSACECRKAWSLASRNRLKGFFFFNLHDETRSRWCNLVRFRTIVIFARSRQTAIGRTVKISRSTHRRPRDCADHRITPQAPRSVLFLMFCTNCGRENGHSKRGKLYTWAANAFEAEKCMLLARSGAPSRLGRRVARAEFGEDFSLISPCSVTFLRDIFGGARYADSHCLWL